MRHSVHDEKVFVRVNSRVLADAERRAQASGMSLSEFVRHAIRKELKEAA